MGNKSKRGPKPVTVAIGYCHPHMVSSFWHGSLIQLLQHERQRVTSVISVMSGPKVDKARNGIMRMWLDGDADYLLMVDTDMLLPYDTIDRLLKHDKDVVGGLCFTTDGLGDKVTPTIRRVEDNKIKVVWDYPTNSLISVDAVGAACLLIRREVAEKMLIARGEDHPLPWFAHGMHNGFEIGEDVAFCLTARTIGYEVWVDTSLEVPHVKPQFVGEVQYVQSLVTESHPKHDERESMPIYQELLNGSTR